MIIEKNSLRKIYYHGWENAKMQYNKHDYLAKEFHREIQRLRQRINGLIGGTTGFEKEIEASKRSLSKYLNLYEKEVEKRTVASNACKYFKAKFREVCGVNIAIQIQNSEEE